ncbi:hypothetical protein ACEPAI_390 [Sanghuangporus weigelae]
MNISSAAVPTLPQPAHFALTFCETRGLFAQRPLEFHGRKGRDARTAFGACVDYPTFGMAGRADSLFSSKRRRTLIEETTEIRFIHPADHLEYSKYRVDFDVLEGIRQLDLHSRKSFVKRLYARTKSAATKVRRKLLSFFCTLLRYT